ncbi:MAG: tyrosine-type recombinase/integrase [Terriglobales bacterium]
MLETYFSAPKTLRRLRSGPSGPYIDGFADALENAGYSHASAIRYLRNAAHLGQFLQRKGNDLAVLDARSLQAFLRHLSRCQCPSSNGGRTDHHARFGVHHFHSYLVRRGISRPTLTPDVQKVIPEIVICFRDWFQKHRGAAEPTLKQYCRGASELIEALSTDTRHWNAQSVRKFVLKRATQCGAGTAQKLITATRAFLRYLSFRGECPTHLDQAVPALAHWRLATLPQCLTAEEVDRIIKACDGSSIGRLRDRAIILLLARLGLRAGDLAQLRLTDIEWENGTLRVIGKGRFEVRLPLPQDVGDALLRYLECRPQVDHTDRVFLRNIAPFKPFVSVHCISGVVKRAMRRAGVKSQAKGAHLLRHTAATEMLRHGVPLEQIGLVLRHRSIDMTAYYAKVDVALLEQVAQPWPEVNS